MADILFTMGLEDEADFLAQTNRVINLVNNAFSNITMPNLAISGEDEILSQANKLATALSNIFSGLAIPPIKLPDLPNIPNAPNAPSGSAPNPAPFNLATASVGELQRELSKLQRQFREGADVSSITAVRNRLRELREEMGAVNPTSFVQRLKTAFSESLASATNWRDNIIQIASGNIIADLFQRLGTAIFDAGKFAIQSAGKFESIRASLDVMTGSLQKGEMIFKQFQTLAAKSPFNFDDVAEQGSKLLAMGIPISDVTNRLSRIGDVAAGVGREKLPSIVYAYGQIKSQGKAMAGDISQFINAGVPIIETLAETLKKPQEEIKHLASTGKIGFKDIDNALIAMTSQGGKFFEMMKTQSNTFEGLWSSMEDAFQLLGVAIGSKLLPAAKEIVIFVSELVSNVTEFISSANGLEEVHSSFYNIASAIGSIIKLGLEVVFQALGATFKFVSDNAFAFSLIVAGLTVAFKSQAIIAAIDTAAIAAYNIVTTAGAAVSQFLTTAIVATALAFENLSVATVVATVKAAAFWLVSNPAGWLVLAGGIIAAAGAYVLLSNSSQAASQQAKIHQDAVTGVIDKYKEEKTQIDGLFGVLSGSSARKKQIDETEGIISLYGDMFKNLNTEKDLLGETEQSAKQKAEQQRVAAKMLIDQYGEILPKYITEKALIGDSAEAEKMRAEARDIIHRKRLAQISEEYIQEQKLAIAKQLIELNLEMASVRAIDERIGKQGALAKIARGLEKEWNDQSVSDFQQREQEKLAILEELNKNGVKIAEDAFNQLKDIDLGASFDEKSLTDKTAKAAEFASGSLKDLQEKLKMARDTMESVNPASNSFLSAAKKANDLDEKIRQINNSVKLLGLDADSLAGLQARLSIIQEEINRANPNSKGFDELIIKSTTYSEKIKVIQDRIKEFSLVGGSMEFLNFQMSQVNEKLNKQPSGSGLIPGLIAQSKELTKQLRDLKIELGLEAPKESLSGLQTTLSELQKQLNETTDSNLLLSIQKEAVKVEKSIDEMNAKIAYAKLLAKPLVEVEPALPSELPTAPIGQRGNTLASDLSISQLSGDYERLNAAMQESVSISEFFGVSQQFISDNFRNIDDFVRAANSSMADYAESMGATREESIKFALAMEEMSLKIKDALSSGISQGIADAASAFGAGIADMLLGLGTFQDAVMAGVMALSKVFLVEIPKAIGMVMIQTAVGMMISSAGLAAPGAIPLLIAGIALVGFSGLAGGLLGALQKKWKKEEEGKKEIPNVNQAFGANTQGQSAVGLSGQNAEKPVLTAYINITMPVAGIDGIILSEIQRQQIIQQELK